MILFISLTFAVAQLVSAFSTCTHSVSCPCGSSGKNFTFCASDVNAKSDPCDRWSQCETCVDFVTDCLSCPSGRSGPICSEAGSPEKIRIRKKRQSRDFGSCTPLEAPKSGLMKCRTLHSRLCVARCLPGFSFENNEDGEDEIILECRRRGWYPRSSFPRCRPQSLSSGCPDPGIPEGADRLDTDGNSANDLRTFTEGESLIFSCSDSVLVGSSLITCKSGTWSDTLPRCVFRDDQNGKSCPPPDMDRNAVIISGTRPMGQSTGLRRYRVDSQLRFGCKDGYDLEGQDVIICLSTGSWSQQPPVCKRRKIDHTIRCTNLGPISNGRVKIFPKQLTVDEDDTYPGGTRLQYSCEDGFVLRGSDRLFCEPPGIWSQPPPSCAEDCGFSKLEAVRKITHATNTLPGEWPWMVSIAIPSGNYSETTCGGALLNRRTVLTAAHCIRDRDPYYILSFGKFFRDDRDNDDQVQIRRSSQITFHRNFNRQTYENDIALIRFQPNVRYTLRVLPICLPTPETTPENVYPGNRGYVTGWGKNELNRRSQELMMAHLPVQDEDKCVDSFIRNGIEDFDMLPGMMCAGFDEGRVATCGGDSGSPLVFQDPYTKRYTVEGCVSFSVRGTCGKEGRYTVFTKVADYMPWVRENMQRRFWDPIDENLKIIQS